MNAGCPIHDGSIVMGGVNTPEGCTPSPTVQYFFFVTKSAHRITLLAALATLLLLIGCTGQYRPYQVAGNSMSPLLSEADHIFADEPEQARADVHDGDIISFAALTTPSW